MNYRVVLVAAALAFTAAAARADDHIGAPSGTGQPFSFMGITIGEPIEEASKHFQFTQCNLPNHPSAEVWGAVPDHDGALILYAIDKKVAAMEYFFTGDRSHELAAKLTDTYGKPNWHVVSLGDQRKWYIPGGEMVIRTKLPDASIIGRIIVDPNYLYRVIRPGRWISCSALDDQLTGFKTRNMRP